MKWIKFILAVTIYLTLTSCDDENEGSVIREFFQQKSLRLSNQGTNNLSLSFDDGENIVFKYSLNHPDEKDISDDELTEVFWFQVPADGTNFSYSSDEIASGDIFQAAYQRLCFCGQINFELTSYTIEATKINATEWNIEFQMQAKDDFNNLYPLSDKGVYSLSSN